MNHRTATISLGLALSTVAGLALLVAHRASTRPLESEVADASTLQHNQDPTALDYAPPPSTRAPVDLDPTTAAPDRHELVCRVDCDALLREGKVPATKLVCRVEFDEMMKEAKLLPSQRSTADAILDQILMDAAVKHARQVLDAGK